MVGPLPRVGVAQAYRIQFASFEVRCWIAIAPVPLPHTRQGFCIGPEPVSGAARFTACFGIKLRPILRGMKFAQDWLCGERKNWPRFCKQERKQRGATRRADATRCADSVDARRPRPVPGIELPTTGASLDL